MSTSSGCTPVYFVFCILYLYLYLYLDCEWTALGGAHGGLDCQETSEQQLWLSAGVGRRWRETGFGCHYITFLFHILYFVFWLWSLLHLYFLIQCFVFHNITYTFLLGIWYFCCHYILYITTSLFYFVFWRSIYHIHYPISLIQIHSFICHATNINLHMRLYDIV